MLTKNQSSELDYIHIPKNLVSWQALPGSQEAFLSSKFIPEVLYSGTRGPGKTDSLLMDFFSDVGKGYGASWKGILFRQTYKQLSDVITKSKKWFAIVCPKARYNASEHKWVFPDGEELLLRQFLRDDDYYNYHGHEYPWIGWEELCNWATLVGYKLMMSTSRSSDPDVAKIIRVRATTNPYGKGHNVVKHRFNLPGGFNKLITDSVDDQGEIEPPRLAIHGHLDENKVLLSAQPDYKKKIRSAARNEAELKAWLYGSWDIIAGGMFDDVWLPGYHKIAPFNIPHSWRVDRSFDWGSSKPFSCGWWAESDGSDVQLADGSWMTTVKGDLFRIGEWYGWNGKPNEGLRLLATEISQGMVGHEIKLNIRNQVVPGPADSSIYDDTNGMCIAKDMEKQVRLPDNTLHRGVQFTRANKGPGSRINGWELVRIRLKNAIPNENGTPREYPGLFVFDTCDQFLRTFPVLPRDDKNLDDVDTDSEDHIGDEVRYRVLASGNVVSSGTTSGLG